jgi:hypothetical protein
MKYINQKFSNGEIETIDCINRNDFKSFKEYKKELKFLLQNYISAHKSADIYISQKSTNDFKNR